MAAKLRDTPRLRDNRSSSRGPDPAHSALPKPPTNRPAAREKTFLDHWVEPPVRAASSYQDHGGLPYGVLEHMQPLGEAPSAKVKARVRPDAVRKSLLGRSVAASGLDAQETPEGTPQPRATPQPPPPQPQAQAQAQPYAIVDDEKDDNYAPVAKKKERVVAKLRAPKRKSDAAASSSHSAANSALPSQPSDSRRASAPSINGSMNKTYDGNTLENVVNAAIERALQVGKPEIAESVREIWVQSLNQPHLADLLDCILTKRATASQTKEFQSYVRAARKRLKDPKSSRTNGVGVGINGTPATLTPETTHSLPPLPLPSGASAPSLPAGVEPPKPKISLKLTKSPPKDGSSHQRPAHPGKMHISPPKKKRSGSVGSDSSLTSLTSHGEDEMDVDDDETVDMSRGPERPKASRSTTRNNLAPAERSMKRTSAEAEFTETEGDRVLAAKKRKLAEGVNRDYNPLESDLRRSTREPSSTRAQRKPTRHLPPSGLNVGVRARAGSEDPDSPLSELSAPDSRRGGTPHIWKGPGKTTGKRAKTKTSPEKKQLSNYRGLSGAHGLSGRHAPIVEAADNDNEEDSENNDFCSACCGSGLLLCCDGCDRSFHLECLDPPMNESSKELNEPWFCNMCVVENPSSPGKPMSKLFAPLEKRIKNMNPQAFHLPEVLQNYYDGVSADKEGNFTETSNVRTTRSKPGYNEQAPDYTKTKDAKGNILTCYSCKKTATGIRALVPCADCPNHWHIDCLDPPLANPPKNHNEWKCPLHVDHALRKIRIQRTGDDDEEGRTIHVRKPRNARIIEASISRGIRNGGVVEIAEDESDASDSEFYETDVPDVPTVYRLPVKGIKLDFIDKVKNMHRQDAIRRAVLERDEHISKKVRPITDKPGILERANFSSRPFAEKQTALNLAQFANANKDLDFGESQIENLVGTLMAEAPPKVSEKITADEDAAQARSSASAIPPSPPASEQPERLTEEHRQLLLNLQELIRRKLEAPKA